MEKDHCQNVTKYIPATHTDRSDIFHTLFLNINCLKIDFIWYVSWILCYLLGEKVPKQNIFSGVGHYIAFALLLR